MVVTASRPVLLLPERSTRYSQTGWSDGHQSWFGEQKKIPCTLREWNCPTGSVVPLSSCLSQLACFVVRIFVAHCSADTAVLRWSKRSRLSVAEVHLITRTQHQSQDVEMTVLCASTLLSCVHATNRWTAELPRDL
jgi:hypothetical protein